MNNTSTLSDWEPVRHKNVTNLVTIDVTEMDDVAKDSIIKGMNSWVQRFKKLYEDLSIKSITNSIYMDAIKAETPRDLIILQGSRKETEEEFRTRMGISDDTSWIKQYMKLTGCTASEAKDQMFKMMKNDLARTPEEWQKFKYDQVDAFLNVRTDKKNK